MLRARSWYDVRQSLAVGALPGMEVTTMKRVQSRQRRSPEPPLSPDADRELRDGISEYALELARESAKVSKRNKTDVISAVHVSSARRNLLNPPPRGISKHSGLVGGAFLGAALSNVSTIVTPSPEPLVNLLTFALAMVGTFLVAVHICRD